MDKVAMAGLKRRQNNSKYTTMSGRNVRDPRKYGDTSSDDAESNKKMKRSCGKSVTNTLEDLRKLVAISRNINSSPKCTSLHSQKSANPQNASQSKSQKIDDSRNTRFSDTINDHMEKMPNTTSTSFASSNNTLEDLRKLVEISRNINSSSKSTSHHTQKSANPQNASQSKSQEIKDSTNSKFSDTTKDYTEKSPITTSTSSVSSNNIFTYGLDFESVPKSCDDANKELPMNFNIDSNFFEPNRDENISNNFGNSKQLNVIDFPVIKELLTQILEKVT